MNIKFATLRDKQALEAWICNLELCHGLKSICMDKDLQGLGKLDEQLGESVEDGLELDEWVNNSVRWLMIALNSTSRSWTRRVG